MKDQYAVIGNPISHSKSPQIHTMFAQETSQALEYTARLAELGGFVESVKSFFQYENGKGLNVTVPFKEQAFALCDELSDYAALAGAVNTLSYRDGKIYGANTDGIGIVRDITQNHNFALADKKILILGAGGAVKGVLKPILDEKPAVIFIANRTAAKATTLADEYGKQVQGGGFADIPEQGFDIIINGTAASLQGNLPPIPDECATGLACCYDMMYSKEGTPFTKWAKQHDVTLILDGLGMLVEQAAESFFIWRGVRPMTETILAHMRGL